MDGGVGWGSGGLGGSRCGLAQGTGLGSHCRLWCFCIGVHTPSLSWQAAALNANKVSRIQVSDQLHSQLSATTG